MAPKWIFIPSTTPPLVPLTISAASMGHKHSLFVTDTGRVFACGRNAEGQLGVGSTYFQQLTPIEITYFPNNSIVITDVAAGTDFSIFRASDGKLYSCGLASGGALGQGAIAPNLSTPQEIVGLTGVNITQVDAGTSHVLALSNTGQVYSWGTNTRGQLATNDTSMRAAPYAVSSGNFISTVVQVSAGGEHSLFRDNGNRGYSCGYNLRGQLGIGSTTSQDPSFYLPQQFGNPANTTDVLDISAGIEHSIILRQSTSPVIWGCGHNFRGELGLGTTNIAYNFQQASGGNAFWNSKIEAGFRRSFAITDTSGGPRSSVLYSGRIPDSTSWIDTFSSTGMPSNTPNPATLVSCHYATIAAIHAGNLYVWGNNGFGQCGDGNTADISSPTILTILG